MDSEAQAKRRSKILVTSGVLSAAAVALYFALGMPGMDHGDSMSSTDHSASTSAPDGPGEQVKVQLLDPERFAERMSAKASVLVNVHVPFEGDIKGTKLSIPFDTIAGQIAKLPADRDTPLLIYCKSGRMSEIAAAELLRLGYRNVSDLDGGMNAWEDSGRILLGVDEESAIG